MNNMFFFAPSFFKKAALLFSTVALTAVSYSFTMTSEVEYVDNGSVLVDSQSGSSGTIAATAYPASSYPSPVGLPPTSASASQTADGNGAFGFVSVDGEWFNGELAGHSASAKNSFVDTVSVTGAYEFSFVTSIARLELFDYSVGGITGNSAGAPFAEYVLDIALNGSSVFYSSVKFIGGEVARSVIKSGVDFGGSETPVVPDPRYGFIDPVFEYVVNGYSDTLDLGILSVGDVLSYSLETNIAGAGWEMGASAFFGDPNDLGHSVTGLVLKSSPPVVGVPDSPAFFAFALALAGMAIVRRRLR